MTETEYTSLSPDKKKKKKTEQLESMGKTPTLIVTLATYMYKYKAFIVKLSKMASFQMMKTGLVVKINLKITYWLKCYSNWKTKQ